MFESRRGRWSRFPIGGGSLLSEIAHAAGRHLEVIMSGLIPDLLRQMAPPAYLDPGSGSYLIQLVIAGALGALFVIRMQWGRIKTMFRRKEDKPPDPDEHVE